MSELVGCACPRDSLRRWSSRQANIGLHRIPITTPAGPQEFATKEQDDEHDDAGGDEG